MNRHFSIKRFRLLSLLSVMWGVAGAIASAPLRAEIPLTRADVESIYNSVDFIADGQAARPATLEDWLNLGDAVRTAENARAELRFNDGSLARIGERATFWFVPNTRDFRLSNGTALFLIPPERGPSNIQTPSAVTGIQGTALVVRHIPYDCDEAASPQGTIPWEECPGRTVVMVLTESPKGPVEVTTMNGQSANLSAGDIAVVEGNSIQVMEFNLEVFYQTSPLVEGLNLDNPDYEGNDLPTDPVRQETWDGLQSQAGFEGNTLLNPEVIGMGSDLRVTTSWLLPSDAAGGVMPPNTLTGSAAQVGSLATQSQPQTGNLMSSRFGNNMSNLVPNQAAIPAGILNPQVGQSPTSTRMGTSAVSQPVITSSSQGGNQQQPSAPSAAPSNPVTRPPVTAPPPIDATPTPSPTPTTPAEPTPSPTPTTPVEPTPSPTPTTPVEPTPSPTPTPPTPVEPTVPTPVDPAPSQPTTPGGQTPPTTPPDNFNPPGNPNPTPSPEPFNPPGNPAPSPDAVPFNPPNNPPLSTDGMVGPSSPTPVPSEIPINISPVEANSVVPEPNLPAGVISEDGRPGNPVETPTTPVEPPPVVSPEPPEPVVPEPVTTPPPEQVTTPPETVVLPTE